MATWAQLKIVPRTEFYQIGYIGTGDNIPVGAKYRDLAGVIPVPDIHWYYNLGTDTYSETAPGPIPKGKISPENLWYGRVLDDERGKIFALSQEDGGGITLSIINRGRLQAFLMFSTASELFLDNPEAIYIFNALETAGAIDAGRADEILA